MVLGASGQAKCKLVLHMIPTSRAINSYTRRLIQMHDNDIARRVRKHVYNGKKAIVMA